MLVAILLSRVEPEFSSHRADAANKTAESKLSSSHISDVKRLLFPVSVVARLKLATRQQIKVSSTKCRQCHM